MIDAADDANVAGIVDTDADAGETNGDGDVGAHFRVICGLFARLDIQIFRGCLDKLMGSILSWM